MTKMSKAEAGKLGAIASAQKAEWMRNQRIAKYNLNPSKCYHCTGPIEYTKKNNKFCSQSCSATYNNTIKPKRKKKITQSVNCKHCSSVIPGHKIFCSRVCHRAFYTKYDPDTRREVQLRRNRHTRAKYRTKLIAQTPSDADLLAIKEFYLKCPAGYEVDHIIPISKGGLHTLSNLQYLTIHENRSKGAKLNWRNKSNKV